MSIDNGEKLYDDPTPDTCYMFAYTSGTTGDPKGGMIRQSYFTVIARYIEDSIGGHHPGDTNISYLPYAHIFENAVFCYSLFTGMRQGYYEGNPLTLF